MKNRIKVLLISAALMLTGACAEKIADHCMNDGLDAADDVDSSFSLK